MSRTRICFSGRGLALAFALAACSAAPNRGHSPAEASARIAAGKDILSEETQAPSSPEDAAEAHGGIVARVAGQPLLASELLAQWMHRDSNGLRALLENLVFARLVVAEARRIGVELPAEMVETRYSAGLERLEAELKEQEIELKLDEYVRAELGLDPERYRQDLRRELEIDLFAERCVRAWLLASERAEVRVLVVRERSELESVQQALAGGEDFAELAKRSSTHESREQGGRIAPVVRSESGLARLAFATPLGQVGGPIAEGGNYLLLLVTGRPTPLGEFWSECGQAVEASLVTEPIQDPEYWQWKAAMSDTYEVDLTPLLELLDGVYEPNSS